MKMFTIDSKKTILRGAAALCAASFLCACAHAPSSTDEAPFDSSAVLAELSSALSDETILSLETGIKPTEPKETVDMSSAMEKVSVRITSRDGSIGDYSFFTCNETQIFGDYSIAHASYDGEDYLMLSCNGVALLAKEDGTDARLFYDGRRLDLPFPCYFNIEYKFIRLQEGDFSGDGSRQLALIIPMETGSGIDVEQLRIVDLDTMTLIPLPCDQEDYEESIYSLFEGHFAETGMTRNYYLFNYVQYSIHDGLIFTEYGACDEDDNYLSFLECSLSYRDGSFILNPAMTFIDEGA